MKERSLDCCVPSASSHIHKTDELIIVIQPVFYSSDLASGIATALYLQGYFIVLGILGACMGNGILGKDTISRWLLDRMMRWLEPACDLI